MVTFPHEPAEEATSYVSVRLFGATLFCFLFFGFDLFRSGTFFLQRILRDKLLFILFRITLVQFFFPQNAPQNFTYHRLRQFLAELDQARHLERSQLLATESHDFRYGQVLPFLRDDIRLDRLTTGTVIDAYGNSFPNFGGAYEGLHQFHEDRHYTLQR